MSKTGYKELAKTLVDKYGLERQAAEQFVEKMFDVLVQGIATDRQVKVKGLGTFKVVPVASRKSVDVNTGEPIVIEGRDKVSFTPDNAMRDLVNRPFSQFETVPVNDGVDFTAIDERFADPDSALQSLTEQDTDAESTPTVKKEEEETESAEAEQATAEVATAEVEPSPAAVEPKPEKVESAEDEPTPAEDKPTTAEDKPTPAEDEPKPAEEAAVPAEPEPVEPDKPDQQEPMQEEPDRTPTPQVTSPVVEAERQADDASNQLIILQQEMTRQHRFMRWVLGAAVLLLLACAGGIFYLFTQLTQRDHRIEHLEAQAILAARTSQGRAILAASVDTAAVAQARKDSLEAAHRLKAEEAARQQAAEEQAATTPPATADNKVKDAAKDKAEKPTDKTRAARQGAKDLEKAPAATAYDKDVRIRTGAYDIVGVERTVVAKAGQTLEGISRTQLGPGMECYIEAVNPGRTQLKAGDKVNIPRLKLKKKK